MNQSAEDIFLVGKKIILAVEDVRYPLRFHPWVNSCDQQTIALDLPDQWWTLSTLTPGMDVQLTTVREECIYGLKGKVQQVNHALRPSLVVLHDNQILRIQRRTFYRLEQKAPLVISRAVLPEGNVLGPLPATLLDISAGGIGCRLERFLPPESRLEIARLFDALISVGFNEGYMLEVRWCRPSQPEGYRLGASFEFENIKDHDRVARIINQLQIVRLSRYTRILGSHGA